MLPSRVEVWLSPIESVNANEPYARAFLRAAKEHRRGMTFPTLEFPRGRYGFARAETFCDGGTPVYVVTFVRQV